MTRTCKLRRYVDSYGSFRFADVGKATILKGGSSRVFSSFMWKYHVVHVVSNKGVFSCSGVQLRGAHIEQPTYANGRPGCSISPFSSSEVDGAGSASVIVYVPAIEIGQRDKVSPVNRQTT